MDLTSLKSEIRHLVDPPNKRSKLRSELLFPVRLLFSSLPDEVIQLIALADIGCQVMAVCSSGKFPRACWVPAPHKLRLVGAGKSLISGGDMGVFTDICLPVLSLQGTSVLICKNVFVHFAEVGDRILLGYPFFLQYRLGFLPTKKFLIPTELLKIRIGPGGYQTRYLSSLKTDSAGGRRTLVQFSEPLVTGFWCLECNPESPPVGLQTCDPCSVSPFITRQVRFLGEWKQCRNTDQTLPSLVSNSAPCALQVKMMNPSAKHPVRATDGAAGYDLYTPIAVDLGPYSHKLIPLGLAISVPQGHYGRLADRSSLAQLGIHILGGVIDSDYRGELKIIVANLSNRRHSFLAGDRVAQLILERHSTPDIQEVPELPSTERGSQGLGSTGRNELTVAADQPVINQIETNSHKHTPILQFIGVLLSLLSQCSAAGDSRCSQSQTSAVGDSLHPQGISVSRIDAVGDSLRGEVSPRLDAVGDSLRGEVSP